MKTNQNDHMYAIRIHQYGGPDMMLYEELPLPTPGEGEVLVEVKAIGVNFIDTYIRSGSYPVPSLPIILGKEGAGVVKTTGPGVRQVLAGDRVAWVNGPGSYATHIIISADSLIPLPDKISFEEGASILLQGMTVHYLTHSTYALKGGDTCLVHAAAGGVGLLLCQIARSLNAHVIGTVSTEEKARLAKDAGANDIIFYTKQNFVEEVMRLTGNGGVNVVYDSVGKDTFDGSLESLKNRGMLVSFGQSSGKIPPFDVSKLSAKSLFLTRPSLFHYTNTRGELLYRAEAVFDWLLSEKIKLHIYKKYPLAAAAEAHAALEGRKTTGKILLIP